MYRRTGASQGPALVRKLLVCAAIWTQQCKLLYVSQKKTGVFVWLRGQPENFNELLVCFCHRHANNFVHYTEGLHIFKLWNVEFHLTEMKYATGWRNILHILTTVHYSWEQNWHLKLPYINAANFEILRETTRGHMWKCGPRMPYYVLWIGLGLEYVFIRKLLLLLTCTLCVICQRHRAID